MDRNEIDVSKPKSKSNPYYYQVKKMIRQYPEFELTYERDGFSRHENSYWVEMSVELENLATELDHPLRDEHRCYNMEHVAGRMEEMVEFAKEHYPKLAS